MSEGIPTVGQGWPGWLVMDSCLGSLLVVQGALKVLTWHEHILHTNLHCILKYLVCEL